MKRSISIASRFNGPPESGNGGYVCGLMAEALGGDARVRLMKPPPLEQSLDLVEAPGGISLQSQGEELARAWSESFDMDEMELPAAPSFESANQAARSFRGFADHIFPACFVCGPDRSEGDGLRIFPGPLDGGPVFAAPWQPDASLATQGSEIDPAFVWAALDCPGCFSFPQPPGIVLLGEMAAHLDGAVMAGESYVLISWQIEHAGRKHVTGTAVHDADGARLGVARATWIEVPRA